MNSKTIFLFLIVITYSVNAKTSNELFSLQRKGGDFISYLITTKYEGNIQSSINKVMDELITMNIKIKYAPNENIRYASEIKKIENNENLFQYRTDDKTFWLDVKYCQSKEEMNLFWNELKIKKWHYTGVNYYDSKIGYTSGKDSNAVIAIIKTKNIVLNLGFELLIKETDRGFETFSVSEQKEILHKTSQLNDVIKIICKQFVKEEDQVYLPITERELNQQERMLGFIKFWTEVKYNFAFFDKVPHINWDKTLTDYLPMILKDQTTFEYYKTLKKLCSLLNDGHTNIYYPDYIDRLIDKPQIEIRNFQNRAYITNVSEALKDKIAIGSEIVEVDGIPTTNYLYDNIFPYYSTSTEYIKWDIGIRDLLRGERITEVEITIKTTNNLTSKIVLQRNFRQTDYRWLIKRERKSNPFEFRWLDESLAYVAFNEFESEEGLIGFEKHLSDLKNAKGLIIDLRQNGGGSTQNGTKIIEYLTDEMFLTSRWKTREMRSAFRAWGQYFKNLSQKEIDELDDEEKALASQSIKTYENDNWYEGEPSRIVPKMGDKITCPIVVLIGHNTASAAEDFLVSLDYLKLGTFVGENTFGSTGQPIVLQLPGGGSGRVCTKRDYFPDGREFVGYGIKPHIYVEQTIEDYLNNYDRVFEQGKEILKSKI